MADKFTGVPDGRWEHLQLQVELWRSLTVLALSLLGLLIITLIRKGVLTGWGDLIQMSTHG